MGILERAVATGGHGPRPPESAQELKATVRVEVPEATVAEEPEVAQRPSVGAVLAQQICIRSISIRPERAPRAGTSVHLPSQQPCRINVKAPRSFRLIGRVSRKRGETASCTGCRLARRRSTAREGSSQWTRTACNLRSRTKHTASSAWTLSQRWSRRSQTRFDTKIRLVLVVEGGDHGSPAPNPPASEQETRSVHAADEFEYDHPGDLEDEQPAVRR